MPSKALNKYLYAALIVRKALCQNITHKLDIRRLPISTSDSLCEKRLALCFDIFGMKLQNKGGEFTARKIAYDTGYLDIAIMLRNAFDKRIDQAVFGPKEIVSRDILQDLCKYGKTKTKVTNPEEILALNLPYVGFSSLSEPFVSRGIKRIALDENVVLQWKDPGIIRFAKYKKHKGLKLVSGDRMLHSCFPSKTFKNYKCKAQRDAIHAMIKEDGANTIIANIPTAGGKSLCYNLPAMWKRRKGKPGTAIVISPIIALQDDQVRMAKDDLVCKHGAKIAVETINSTLEEEKKIEIYRKFAQGKLDVLLLSPEKLWEPFFKASLMNLAKEGKISFLVIDEAHMVPEWGRDFRTEFSRLGELRKELLRQCPTMKTLILSATLTPNNARKVLRILKIQEDHMYYTEPELREEISVRVERHANRDQITDRLIEILPDLPRPAIIYCKRKDYVNQLKRELNNIDLYRLNKYTGSTNKSMRRKILNDFMYDDISYIIATNAFGLGVNKPDVRTVLHYDIPDNLDVLYQQMGRSARDKKTGHEIILYTKGGIISAAKTSLSLITAEKSEARIKILLKKKIMIQSNSKHEMLLPIHEIPDHLENKSEINETWNLAVLNILEIENKLHIKGKVYRRIEVLSASSIHDDYGEYGRIVQKIFSKKSKYDLAKIAIKNGLDYEGMFNALMQCIIKERMNVRFLDDMRDPGDMHNQNYERWVLIEMNPNNKILKKDFIEFFEIIRNQELREISTNLKNLKSFLKSQKCRMTHFARIYEYKYDKQCGICDICYPRLKNDL